MHIEIVKRLPQPVVGVRLSGIGIPRLFQVFNRLDRIVPEIVDRPQKIIGIRVVGIDLDNPAERIKCSVQITLLQIEYPCPEKGVCVFSVDLNYTLKFT